jgi:hypothetical protein
MDKAWLLHLLLAEVMTSLSADVTYKSSTQSFHPHNRLQRALRGYSLHTQPLPSATACVSHESYRLRQWGKLRPMKCCLKLTRYQIPGPYNPSSSAAADAWPISGGYRLLIDISKGAAYIRVDMDC